MFTFPVYKRNTSTMVPQHWGRQDLAVFPRSSEDYGHARIIMVQVWTIPIKIQKSSQNHTTFTSPLFGYTTVFPFCQKLCSGHQSLALPGLGSGVLNISWTLGNTCKEDHKSWTEDMWKALQCQVPLSEQIDSFSINWTSRTIFLLMKTTMPFGLLHNGRIMETTLLSARGIWTLAKHNIFPVAILTPLFFLMVEKVETTKSSKVCLMKPGVPLQHVKKHFFFRKKRFFFFFFRCF